MVAGLGVPIFRVFMVRQKSVTVYFTIYDLKPEVIMKHQF